MTEKEKIIQDIQEIVGLRNALLVADYIIARDEKKQGGSVKLDLLKQDPEYAHINIDEEYEKAKRWVSGKKVRLTTSFFMKWLNRIEKPLYAVKKCQTQMEAF